MFTRLVLLWLDLIFIHSFTRTHQNGAWRTGNHSFIHTHTHKWPIFTGNACFAHVDTDCTVGDCLVPQPEPLSALITTVVVVVSLLDQTLTFPHGPSRRRCMPSTSRHDLLLHEAIGALALRRLVRGGFFRGASSVRGRNFASANPPAIEIATHPALSFEARGESTLADSATRGRWG